MQVVIFAGGTGSIALQRGLYDTLEKHLDGIDTKIVVNAYDNGLSTGAVRRVLDGRILGPSDVRKNQTTRIRLRDPSDPWLPLLECRITADSAKARQLCNDKVLRLISDLERTGRSGDHCSVLLDAVSSFFRSSRAETIRYEDFSVSNIIYAGLAAANGNSLRAAARIMADAMELPDNVLLNDDRSLFLGAVTQSGKRISDEGDIVTWGREGDSIVDVFFVDPDGNSAIPELCLETWKAVVEADVIILSSGTPWSSLIPTYASRGFAAAVRDSDAKILMVMNRTPDKDSPGQTAGDMVNALVPRFFDEGRLHLLIDNNGHPRMRRLDGVVRSKLASITEAELSGPSDPPDRHDPARLARNVGYVCFQDYIDSDFFLFDYDDTLCGRANRFPKSSRFNIEGISRLNELTHVGICTGNTIKALDFSRDTAATTAAHIQKQLLVFADGGANEYAYDTCAVLGGEGNGQGVVKCISPQAMLPATGPHSAGEIIDALQRAGIPQSMIENRGNAVIAIKPIPVGERRAVMSLVRHIVSGSDLHVVESGKTTVEIRRRGLSKVLALQHLCATSSNMGQLTYVGDELDGGNDHDIHEFAAAEPRIRCLHVDSPSKTAFFICTLIERLQADAQR